MNKYLFLFFLLTFLLLVACNSDNTGTAVDNSDIVSVHADTFDDLPNCSKNREGDLAEVQDERKAYRCQKGAWEFDHDVLDTVKTEDDLPACTGRKEGLSLFVQFEHAVYTCDGMRWTKVEKENVDSGAAEYEFDNESSSPVIDSKHYDCKVYNCVTTQFLNKNFLTAGKYGELLDERDNQVYRTVKIGNQVWMAQNLNYAATGSVCYDNENSNCDAHGRLYYGSDLNICPEGWRVPSEDNFLVMLEYVEGKDIQRDVDDLWIIYKGTENSILKLRSASYEWVSEKASKGTDIYGFSLIPSGSRWDYGEFAAMGSNSRLWTVSKSGSRNIVMHINVDYGIVRSHYDLLSYAFSVRCLKDSN